MNQLELGFVKDSRRFGLPLAIGALLFLPVILGQEDCQEADGDGDGWTMVDGDCDDTDADVHPGAAESCDGIDNDCDTEVDESAPCTDCVSETYGDHEYLFCSSSTTWELAEESCNSVGKHLVTINGSDEDAWLMDTALTYVDTGYGWWCGFNDLDSEGTFVWSSGQESAYTHWDSGEPNDSNGEDCTTFLHWDAYVYAWNDLPCTIEIPYVCE